MSTQSILELNRQTYFDKSQEQLLCLSDDYFYKKKLFIGEGVDRDKMRFYMQNNRFLCEDNCTLTEYIKDKIEGKEKNDHQKKINNNILECIENIACDNCKAEKCTCNWSEINW